jgi:y4mF family transcriptional regulator
MTVQDTTQLGATIREARKRLQVTQKDLAMTSGTGLRFVIDLERGKPTCQIGKILQVLQALGLRLILTGSAASTPEEGAS